MSNGAWERYVADLDEQRELERDEADACACSYGYFLGGDPRQFAPDEECCTPEEIARWQALCAEWDAGRQTEPAPEEHGPWVDPSTRQVIALGARPDQPVIGLCHAPRSFGIGVTTCDRCWRDRALKSAEGAE
jgi:hypothetical protein